MADHLPTVYTEFRNDHPGVAAALDALGEAADEAGPLDEKTTRLAKLALAVGAGAEGAVRSNVRKALEAGARPEEVSQIGVLAITTIGFPAAVASLGWIDEVLTAR